MGFHPKPPRVCRDCNNPTPHIHPDLLDDPLAENVPVAIANQETTPSPSTPISKLERRSVIVDGDGVSVEADEIDNARATERVFRRK